MKKFLLVAALLVGFNGAAWGWGTTGGDGSRFTQLQETAVFFNNSGASLSTGDVVILDISGTGVASGSTLGAYITVSTSADSILAIGVVKSRTAINQGPVVVVTKGPATTFCANRTDLTTAGVAVGTTTVTNQCGGGTNLGIALDAGTFDVDGNAQDGNNVTVWVSPTGAD